MMPSDPHGVEEAAVTGEIIEKHRDPRGSSLLLEAAGLRWLAEAEPAGGIRVARVTGARDDVLVEERVATGPPSRAAAHRIGVGLARLHAAGAPWLGCPPPGWPLSAVEGMTPVPACRGLWVGRARTPLVARADAPLTWGAFFAEHRIRYYVRLLRDSGRFGARETALLSRVADRVSAGFFDAPQPELVRGAIARAPGVAWVSINSRPCYSTVSFSAESTFQRLSPLPDATCEARPPSRCRDEPAACSPGKPRRLNLTISLE